jgi:YkoY family integral membrane protein
MIQSMLDQLIELPQQFGLQTLVVIGILILLEAVLSADNAIALAAIVQGLHDPKLEQKALNWGLSLAFILRIALILTATWVLKFPLVSIVGGLYLLWLAWKYVRNRGHEEPDREWQPLTPAASVWQVVPTLALTDLAFSLDSITTAIAVAEETWLVLLGGVMGIVALRFLAGLFIRWLETYTYLQDAGYATVVLVGMRLLLKAIHPELLPPEWVTTSVIVLLFVWGFSKKNPETPLSS